jgi:tetratricopeptide (TPR) repeat protein
MKALASQDNPNKGGRLPAFVLLGLWAAFVLAPDTALLDLKRALGFAFVAAAGLWLAGLAWLRKPIHLPSRRLVFALGGLALAYAAARLASPYPQAGGFRLELLELGILTALLTACLPVAFASRWAWVALASALLVALYALAQRLGLEPISAYAQAGSQARAMGSFGNATFLAAFLCLSWPLALLLPGRWRLAAVALFWAALLATQSRAGIIALAVQLAVLGWQAWQVGLRPAWGRTIFAGLLFAAATAWLFPPAQWQRPTLRLQVWSQTLRMVAQRPWLGSGPGSFPLAFQEQEPPALAEALGSSQFVEDPHNWILSVLQEAGFIGLLAFGWLLWVVKPWPRLDAPRKPGQAFLAIGLLGLLVQNLFDRNLGQAGLAVCFYFGLGFLSRQPATEEPQPWPRWAALPLLAITMASLFLGLRPILAYAAAVGPAPGLSPAQGSVGALRSEASRNPSDPSVWDRLGDGLVAQSAFSEAADAFSQALALQPSPGRAINLGNCQMMLNQAIPAETSFRRAVELAPDNADAHFSLGYALFYQKRLKEALAELDLALQLDPSDAAAAKLKEQILR